MNNYGVLYNEQTIKMQRMYFKQALQMRGIPVIYRAPLPGKQWTTYSELDMNYQPPEIVGCFFEEHPTQKTMKKLNWVSELQTDASLIQVPYDLHDLQVGALFIIPSGIDNSKGRLFKVVSMSNIMLYPTSITCEIVPEYENTFSETLHDFKQTSFNLLRQEDDDL